MTKNCDINDDNCVYLCDYDHDDNCNPQNGFNKVDKFCCYDYPINSEYPKYPKFPIGTFKDINCVYNKGDKTFKFESGITTDNKRIRFVRPADQDEITMDDLKKEIQNYIMQNDQDMFTTPLQHNLFNTNYPPNPSPPKPNPSSQLSITKIIKNPIFWVIFLFMIICLVLLYNYKKWLLNKIS